MSEVMELSDLEKIKFTEMYFNNCNGNIFVKTLKFYFAN